MDAVDFIKTRARMCSAHDNCGACSLCDFCAQDYSEQVTYQVAEQAIANVEQWAKEHPVKTRQSEFLKQWPDAEISDDGLPSIAPCQLNVGLIHGESQKDCEDREVCDKCRHDFWLKEIE